MYGSMVICKEKKWPAQPHADRVCTHTHKPPEHLNPIRQRADVQHRHRLQMIQLALPPHFIFNYQNQKTMQTWPNCSLRV